MSKLNFFLCTFILCLTKLIPTHAQSSTTHAALTVSSSKKKITIGESFVLSVSFDVYKDNKARIRFYEVSRYLTAITEALATDHAWIHESHQDEIVQIDTVDAAGQAYQKNVMLKIAVTPVRPGVLHIPSVSIDMALGDPAIPSTPKQSFRSQPLAIEVDATPVYDTTVVCAIGTFNIQTSPIVEEISLGDTVEYKINIRGNGNSFPLVPEIISQKACNVQIKSIHVVDYLENDVLIASSRIVLSLTPRREGNLALKELIKPLKYFSPLDGSYHSFTPSEIITVRKGAVVALMPLRETNTPVLAIDISNSMRIMTDYSPNRLGFLLKELKLLTRDTLFHPDLLLFDGMVHFLTITSPADLDQIDYKLKQSANGSTFGDVIWRTINQLKDRPIHQRKLIIVSDGDENTRNVTYYTASMHAKKLGVKIYTIGIGTPGVIKINDELAYKDTFSSEHLQEIARITNGKYFYIKRKPTAYGDWTLKSILTTIADN